MIRQHLFLKLAVINAGQNRSSVPRKAHVIGTPVFDSIATLESSFIDALYE
jgi:hypothetical protein